MTNKQLLQKFEREHAGLVVQRDAILEQLAGLGGVIASLRRLLGEAPPPPTTRSGRQATGTKALILDVLADGQERSVSEIAALIKVKAPATGWHLKDLVLTKDVIREGRSHKTRYRIP